MSDHKKVAFSTVNSTKEVKKKSIKCRTVRLLVTLPESNEKSCPEFNYGDLLSQHFRERLGKKTMGVAINGPSLEAKDPFADDDDDDALRLLAKQFEKKYGRAVPGKSRKPKRENSDFKKLGEGYDETDPFIDNSDAVDDVVPTNMETKHRGFYINSGALDFEEVQVSEEEEGAASNDSDVQMTKRKKKCELSSDEEDTAIEEKDENKTKTKEVRENGVISLKKRDLDEGELLRKRKRMIDKFNAKKLKTDKVDSDTEAKSPAVDGATEESKPLEKSIAASIEAVVNKARNAINEQDNQHLEEMKEVENKERPEDKESSSSSAASSSSSSSSSSESSSSESESEDDKESENEEEKKTENEDLVTSQLDENGILSPSENEKDISLPNNLPQDLIKVIDQIKESGKNSKASSQKFFTDDVKKLLLSIEIKLCNFGGRKKTLIYNHLSQHLPCGTQTLVKRGKNALMDFLEDQMKGPIGRLKEAISTAMPPLVEAYAAECQKVAEQKGQGEGQGENDSADSLKKQKLPKKKFNFTSNLRDALCEVVSVRCKGWNMLKKRSESPEEHIIKFLESDVKGFWPKGWVTTKILYKESESAHAFITATDRVVPQKKITVLGGGTVTNNNNNDIQTATKNLEESLSKRLVPCDLPQIEKVRSPELNEAKPTKHSNSLQDSKANPSESDTQLNSQLLSVNADEMEQPENKISKIEEETLKPPSVSITPITPISSSLKEAVKDFSLKNARDLQGRLQVSSPISDSSSFLGFESPARATIISTIKEPVQAKLNIVSEASIKVTNSSVPHVREGKPPKPSLTATAMPKISLPNPKLQTKIESFKKIYDEKLELCKNKDDRTINCISIKSVDKINETFKGNPSLKKRQLLSSPIGTVKDKRTLSTDSSKSGDSVSVIDVSSDEEKKKIVCEKDNSSVSSLNSAVLSEKETRKDYNITVSSSIENSVVKDSKLEQEMDQVMLELLQISKQKKSNEEKSEDTMALPKVSAMQDVPQNLHQPMMPPKSTEPLLSPTNTKTSSPVKLPASSSSPIISKKAHLLADPHANYTPTVDSSQLKKSPTSSASLLPPRMNALDLINTIPITVKENPLTNKITIVPSHSASGEISLNISKDITRGSPTSLTLTSLSTNQSLNLTTTKTVTLNKNMMSPPISSAREIQSSTFLNLGGQRGGVSSSNRAEISDRSSELGQTFSVDLTMPFKKDSGTSQKREHSSTQKDVGRLHVVDSIVKRMDHQTPSQRYRQDQLSPHKENHSSRSYYKPTPKDQPSHGGSYYAHSGNIHHSTGSSVSSSTIQSSVSRSSPSPQQSPSRSVSPYRQGQKSPKISSYNSSQSGNHLTQGFPSSHRSSQSGKIVSPVPSYGAGYSSTQGTGSHFSSSSNDRLSLSSVSSHRPSHSGQDIPQSRSPIMSHSMTGATYNSSSKNQSPGRSSPRSLSSSTISQSSSKLPSHNIDGLLYNSSYSSQSRTSMVSQPLQSRYGHPQHSSSHKQEKSSSSAAGTTWAHNSVPRVKSSHSKHKPSDSYPAASQTSSQSSSSAQPKLKQRDESYSLSHSIMGNLTAEQQMELLKQQSSNQPDFWQQMNAGGFLPGMPPNESYKYRSQQGGSYQGSNSSSGSSTKKSNQY